VNISLNTMAGKMVIKPYKLKPSGDILTRVDLSTWKQILLGHIRQNPSLFHFLLSSATHKTWTCMDEDETNALVMMIQQPTHFVHISKTNIIQKDTITKMHRTMQHQWPGWRNVFVDGDRKQSSVNFLWNSNEST
jgi:hypothetical protein